MKKRSLPISAAMLAALAWCGAAAADSLSCRSINGNVTCAAPNARSCQTVDGRTVCTSGRGDAVQSFGGASPDLVDPDLPDPDLEEVPDLDEPTYEFPDHELDGATGDLVLERRGPFGQLSLWRENGRLRIDTGRLQLDLR